MDPLAGVIAQMGAPVGDTAAVDVNWTLFTNTFQSIDTPLVDAVTATIGALTGYLAPIMVPMLTVYLIIFGIQSAMGRVPLSAFLSVALRAAVVVYIIANAANFNQWVGNVFLQAIPNDIGNAVNGALGGGAPINGGQQFDTVWNDAYTAGLVVWKALPSLSLKGIMMCGVVVLFWATALASVALGFLMFLASRVLMALLIAIGPIFIACALFGASRQFFNGWLSACVSTVVAQLLIVTLMSLMIRVETTELGRIAAAPVGGNVVGQAGALMGVSALLFICALLAKQIPNVAVGIAGGAYHNLNTYTHAAGGAASAAASGARSAGGAAMSAGTANFRSSAPTTPTGKSLGG